MAQMLFETNNRNESHQKLEAVLAEGLHPLAECREQTGRGIFQVWDGPEDKIVQPTVVDQIKEAAEVTVLLSEKDLERLAELVAAKLKG